MAQNVVINTVTYQNVPQVQIPKSGGGTASFYDIADATIDNGNKLLDGVTAYGNGVKYTGSIQSKAAASYLPSGSDQSIAASQYLSGAQTIKAVTTTNLLSQYIQSGITVKVGCADDDDCVTSVQGGLTSPVVSQDGTSKVLSIS